VAFDIVCMAGLENYLYHGVYLVLVYKSVDELKSSGVGGHAGAADVEVTLCESLVYITCLVHQLVYALCAAAVFIYDDLCAVVLNALDDLFAGAAYGAACNHDSRTALELVLGAILCAVVILSLDLLYNCAHLARYLALIELKCGAVEHLIHVAAQHWSRLHFHQAVKLLESLSAIVLYLDGLSYLIICYRDTLVAIMLFFLFY